MVSTLLGGSAAGGTSRAKGQPCRAMVICSPVLTASSSAARWVLASKAPTDRNGQSQPIGDACKTPDQKGGRAPVAGPYGLRLWTSPRRWREAPG
jgi:hypothetical protein